MFYHNLVTVLNADYFNDPNVDRMVDLGRRHITTNYPTLVNNSTWGVTTNPAVIKAYEYITAENTINSPYVILASDVSYLAGKEVTLGNGFSAVNGNFSAAIQHFECGEILTNPINSAVNARAGHTDTTKNDQAIYPNLMATSYETAKIPVVAPLTKQVDDKPTVALALVDGGTKKSSTTMPTTIVAEIAPNPNQGLCKVFLTNPNSVASIEVVDAFAKSIFNIYTISYSNDIDLSSCSKGVYSIIIRGNQGEINIKKVVVQ